jgi:hypothetical protein
VYEVYLGYLSAPETALASGDSRSGGLMVLPVVVWGAKRNGGWSGDKRQRQRQRLGGDSSKAHMPRRLIDRFDPPMREGGSFQSERLAVRYLLVFRLADRGHWRHPQAPSVPNRAPPSLRAVVGNAARENKKRAKEVEYARVLKQS